MVASSLHGFRIFHGFVYSLSQDAELVVPWTQVIRPESIQRTPEITIFLAGA